MSSSDWRWGTGRGFGEWCRMLRREGRVEGQEGRPWLWGWCPRWWTQDWGFPDERGLPLLLGASLLRFGREWRWERNVFDFSSYAYNIKLLNISFASWVDALCGTRFYNNAAKIFGTEAVLCRRFVNLVFMTAYKESGSSWKSRTPA